MTVILLGGAILTLQTTRPRPRPRPGKGREVEAMRVKLEIILVDVPNTDEETITDLLAGGIFPHGDDYEIISIQEAE